MVCYKALLGMSLSRRMPTETFRLIYSVEDRSYAVHKHTLLHAINTAVSNNRAIWLRGTPRFPSQRVLPSLADRPMLAVRPGAALIPSHYQYRRKVVYDQPELAESSNLADL
jgi:hypothetical protein